MELQPSVNLPRKAGARDKVSLSGTRMSTRVLPVLVHADLFLVVHHHVLAPACTQPAQTVFCRTPLVTPDMIRSTDSVDVRLLRFAAIPTHAAGVFGILFKGALRDGAPSKASDPHRTRESSAHPPSVRYKFTSPPTATPSTRRCPQALGSGSVRDGSQPLYLPHMALSAPPAPRIFDHYYPDYLHPPPPTLQ